MTTSATSVEAKCPSCNSPTEMEDGPPWNPVPHPALCVRCDNEAEQAAEDKRVLDNIQAAARAGRFDLI